MTESTKDDLNKISSDFLKTNYGSSKIAKIESINYGIIDPSKQDQPKDITIVLKRTKPIVISRKKTPYNPDNKVITVSCRQKGAKYLLAFCIYSEFLTRINILPEDRILGGRDNDSLFMFKSSFGVKMRRSNKKMRFEFPFFEHAFSETWAGKEYNFEYEEDRIVVKGLFDEKEK